MNNRLKLAKINLARHIDSYYRVLFAEVMLPILERYDWVIITDFGRVGFVNRAGHIKDNPTIDRLIKDVKGHLMFLNEGNTVYDVVVSVLPHGYQDVYGKKYNWYDYKNFKCD